MENITNQTYILNPTTPIADGNINEDVKCFKYSIQIFDAFLFILIAVLAIIGNVLVFICYYRFRSLRTVTNIFIISLTMSDVFVAILSIPYSFGVFVCEVRPVHDNRGIADLIYLVCDMLPSILSIHSLTLVALDRAIAITKPYFHQKYVNRRRATIAVTIMWIYTSCLVSLIFAIEAAHFTLFIIITTYVFPITIMLISYTIMGYVAKKHAKELNLLDKTAKRLRFESTVSSAEANSNNNTPVHRESKSNGDIINGDITNPLVQQRSSSIWSGKSLGRRGTLKIRSRSISIGSPRHLRRELKAAMTLSLILSCFTLSWTPFIALNLELFRCPTCYIPYNLAKYFKVLHYSNSALNPILFVLLNKRWRAAFLKTIGCTKPQQTSESSQTELFGW